MTALRSLACRYSLLVLALILAAPRRAVGAETVKDQIRLTLVVTQPIQDKLSAVGAIGWFSNPNKSMHSLYFSPLSIVYKPEAWCELWLGIFSYYNDREDVDDSLEIRPRAGVKLFLPNDWKWNLYNFTRLEYRFIEDLGSDHTDGFARLRNRTGAEFPLSQATAWQSGSFYGITDVEPYFRLDENELEFIRGRIGTGRVLGPRWRVELLYCRQFARGSDGDFERSDNIWRINFKLNLGAPGRNAPAADDDPAE